MKVENTYPKHTTEEEWSELALLASKILANADAPAQGEEASATAAV